MWWCGHSEVRVSAHALPCFVSWWRCSQWCQMCLGSSPSSVFTQLWWCFPRDEYVKELGGGWDTKLSFTWLCFCSCNLQSCPGWSGGEVQSVPSPNIQEVPWAYCSELHFHPQTRKKCSKSTYSNSAYSPLSKSCSCSPNFFFTSSLGCQRGERSPNENCVCLITTDDTLIWLCSGLHRVFQLLLMKLMKTAVHTVSRQVLQRLPSLLMVLAE